MINDIQESKVMKTKLILCRITVFYDAYEARDKDPHLNIVLVLQ